MFGRVLLFLAVALPLSVAGTHLCNSSPSGGCDGACLQCSNEDSSKYCFSDILPANSATWECCGCKSFSNKTYCVACPQFLPCEAEESMKFRCGPQQSRLLGPFEFTWDWISPESGAALVRISYASILAQITTLTFNTPKTTFNVVIGTVSANVTLSVDYLQTSLPPIIYIDITYLQFQRPRARYAGLLGGFPPLPPCLNTSPPPSPAATLNLGAIIADVWTFSLNEPAGSKTGAAVVRTTTPGGIGGPVAWHLLFAPPSGLPRDVSFTLPTGLEFVGSYTWKTGTFHLGGLLCNNADCKEVKKSAPLSPSTPSQCSF